MSHLMPTDVSQYNCHEDYKNNLQATCFYVNLTRRKNPLSVYFLYLKRLMEYPPEHKVRSHHPLNHGRIYKEHYIQVIKKFQLESFYQFLFLKSLKRQCYVRLISYWIYVQMCKNKLMLAVSRIDFRILLQSIFSSMLIGEFSDIYSSNPEKFPVSYQFNILLISLK